MKDLALPPPGTEEPQGKPSQARIGAKPVLPPPKKDLTQELVENAAKQAAAAAAAAEIPLLAEAPPPDLRVEREPQRPHTPMKRERSKSKSMKVKLNKAAAKKTRHAPIVFDDSEVAVVARDPRRPREE